MVIKTNKKAAEVVLPIDSKSPWRATLRAHAHSIHPYRKSITEWRELHTRATRGESEAEWQVAGIYDDGCKNKKGVVIVRRSKEKAILWLGRAANHGCRPAQNTFGVCLTNGDGVRRNVRQGLWWLKRAFRDRDAGVAHNIALTYRQIGELRRAVKWLQTACNLGDGDALVQLGIHYYWGKGVRKNPNAAVRCFRKAINSNCISGYGRDDAFFFLGLSYLEGAGLERSLTKARRLLRRADADHDHPIAGKLLARLRANPY